MAKKINATLRKRFGPNPNYSLLVRVRRYAAEASKKTGKNSSSSSNQLIQDAIDEYEREHGVTIDLHRARELARQKAVQAALARIRSR